MKRILWNDNWFFSSDIDPQPRAVRLPHDAMQTEKRVPGLKDGSGTGYYPGGIYTYTKTFDWDGSDETALLEFEGIYMKSSILLNGEAVGGHIYGYTGFYVDLTGKLLTGRNKITVIADNSQFPNSRWYSGSGIYRDVVLHTAGKEYIRPDGIRVTTLSTEPATIRVRVDAVKTEETQLLVRICKNGKTVAEAAGEDVTLQIPAAKLWSAETPELYDVQAVLMKSGKELDNSEDRFGIRTLAWDAASGFQVNGNTVKFRGGCVHHDHGVIGAAEYEEACLRKVRIMKESGFNAVRISHNPASRAMLRACDRFGMYVMNESFDTWLGLKNPYDYAMYFEQEWENDLGAMIRVSYNHPSVVLYSIGNEVYLKDIPTASRITRAMVDFCHSQDPSRAVINALNPMTVIMGNSKNPEQNRSKAVEDPREAAANSGPVGSRLANTLISALPLIMKVFGNEKAMKKRAGCMDPLDIVGLNYAEYLYDDQHKDYPARVLCGSETFPQKIASNWKGVLARPWVIGDFLWTAWDYLGEAGIGTVGYGKAEAFTQPFPVAVAGCSNIDLTGEINCQGIYTAIVYGHYKKPYIAVHPADHAGEKAFLGQWRFTDAVHSWTWKGFEGKTVLVDVYSNAPEVELFQDGQSLGKQATKDCKATYEVSYRGGELKALAAGEEDVLQTAGNSAVLCLLPEKQTMAANGRDLLYLPVEIRDENGIRQTQMDREIKLSINGEAELIGFGNAALRQESAMPFATDTALTWQGRALAVLRSTNAEGKITVTVTAEGMDSRSIELNSLKTPAAV